MKEAGEIFMTGDLKGISLVCHDGVYYLNHCYKGYRTFCKAQIGYDEYSARPISMSVSLGDRETALTVLEAVFKRLQSDTVKRTSKADIRGIREPEKNTLTNSYAKDIIARRQKSKGVT